MYVWREQAIIEWSRCAISIVACCHSAKLYAFAAQAFWSQQNGAVTRMWRLCQVQPSHKECAVRCKKEGVAWRWLCDSPWTGCARRRTLYIYICVARTSYNRVIMARDQISIIACCHSV